jgi:hypothetical protein
VAVKNHFKRRLFIVLLADLRSSSRGPTWDILKHEFTHRQKLLDDTLAACSRFQSLDHDGAGHPGFGKVSGRIHVEGCGKLKVGSLSQRRLRYSTRHPRSSCLSIKERR